MPVPTHIFENPNHFFDWENTVILENIVLIKDEFQKCYT